MISYMNISQQTFVTGYRHFPTDFSLADVSMLIKHNSFITSFLTMENGEPCINCVPTKPSVSQNFFQKFTACLKPCYSRFKIVLDNELQVKTVSFFDMCDGTAKPIKISSKTREIESILTVLLYSFQCMHSVLHIFEGFVTSCMYNTAQGNQLLSSWLEPYVPNVLEKMEDVIALLISDTFPAILTEFWIADRDRLLLTMKEFITMLGNLRNEADLFNVFLFKGVPEESPLHQKLLPEFRKQTALVPGYAKAITSHMLQNPGYSFTQAESKMRSEFRTCGPGIFGISTIDQWIQVQALVALMHGSASCPR